MEIYEDYVVHTSLPHIFSAFDNVISNAIKYSYANGIIRIFAKDLGHQIAVYITDTGIGLTQSELKRIFEPFFKADPSRHDRSSSGLGLSVTKRLIQVVGGSISLHSEGPGRGTEVEIRLNKLYIYDKI